MNLKFLVIVNLLLSCGKVQESREGIGNSSEKSLPAEASESPLEDTPDDHSAEIPEPHPEETKKKPACSEGGNPDFPSHWGTPPTAQTKDLRPFPEPYTCFRGSGTVANWIREKQQQDEGKQKASGSYAAERCAGYTANGIKVDYEMRFALTCLPLTQEQMARESAHVARCEKAGNTVTECYCGQKVCSNPVDVCKRVEQNGKTVTACFPAGHVCLDHHGIGDGVPIETDCWEGGSGECYGNGSPTWPACAGGYLEP